MKSAWAGFLLSLSLCLDLGIVNVAVLRTALDQGGTAGFLVGVGSCAGDLVYFALAVLGAAALLEWAPVRWALWIFGTCVLLVLAWRMAREVIHPRSRDLMGGAGAAKAPMALLAMGAGLALASPSAILWFAAVGGSVIASMGSERATLWEFTTGFFVAGVVWSGIFAYSAAGFGGIVGQKMTRALSLISALLFLYFAVVVFLDGLRLVRPAGP